jgi:hypothetical protein
MTTAPRTHRRAFLFRAKTSLFGVKKIPVPRENHPCSGEKAP